MYRCPMDSMPNSRRLGGESAWVAKLAWIALPSALTPFGLLLGDFTVPSFPIIGLLILLSLPFVLARKRDRLPSNNYQRVGLLGWGLALIPIVWIPGLFLLTRLLDLS